MDKLPFQPITAERAEKIAAKRTKRQRDAMPLFADQIEDIDPAAVQAAAARRAERFRQLCAEMQQRGDGCREQVRRLVIPAQFAELERRRAVLPPSAEYHADFWRRALAALLRRPC